jgi:hypothetical protein
MRDVPGLNAGSRHNDMRDRYGVSSRILSQWSDSRLGLFNIRKEPGVSAEKLTSWAIPHSGRFREKRIFLHLLGIEILAPA